MFAFLEGLWVPCKQESRRITLRQGCGQPGVVLKECPSLQTSFKDEESIFCFILALGI